jgi:hypothetical protein
MRKNSPVKVLLLSLITFGIYGLVWLVRTKNDMNKLGATIPTAWLLIIPFVSYYWMWKYSEGVELVTNSKISAILAFVMQALIGFIAFPILQSEFNKVGDTNPNSGGNTWQPTYPNDPSNQQPTVVGPTPDGTFGGPAVITPTVEVSQTPAPLQTPPQVVAPTPEAYDPNSPKIQG